MVSRLKIKKSSRKLKAPKTYAFIDASNLFYGGEKSLGLKNKYNVNKTFYFGGVEMHDFRYNYLINNSVPLAKLEKYLATLIKYNDTKLSDGDIILINRHLKRVKFYHNSLGAIFGILNILSFY